MHEISLRAEELFTFLGFTVTNALLLSIVSLGILAIFAVLIRTRLSLIPGKFQGFFEVLIEQILKLMDSVLGNRKLSEKYLPLVATIFLFIVVSNWLGLVPGIGPLGLETEHDGHHVFTPLFRAPAADLNFKNPIFSFAGLLEFISEFVKIISFSFRLFGNIFAGEVLLIIVGFLVPYAIPLPFLFLEVFVGFIQAFIFAMLTLVFIAMAVSEEPAH
jgi:F-type H+-transporting ATPase subunit a